MDLAVKSVHRIGGLEDIDLESPNVQAALDFAVKVPGANTEELINFVGGMMIMGGKLLKLLKIFLNMPRS